MEESVGDDEESADKQDEEEDGEDGPRHPAVEAITMRLVEGGGGGSPAQGWNFAPEFTHQLFEGEEVPPGYPQLSIRCVCSGLNESA